VTEARDAVLSLLDERQPGRTICPSEAARKLNTEAWRDEMDRVHHAVDRLVAEGVVMLSWKGEPLTRRQGPYRIGRSSG